MIEELKNNIDEEINILREISAFIGRRDGSTVPGEKKMLNDAVLSLQSRLRILNNSIPNILKNISATKKLPSTSKAKSSRLNDLEKVSFKSKKSEVEVVLKKSDREKFMLELSIGENLIRRIGKKTGEVEEKKIEYKSASGYPKLANRFFFNATSKLLDKGYFKPLAENMRRSNIGILFRTYIATILFTVFLSFFVGIIIMIGSLFFNLGFLFPFFSVYNGSILGRFVRVFWIPFAVPLATFAFLYFYPSMEKDSVGKRIDQELPFAVIHMSAISGSGIEPSEIFRIIGTGRDYPNLKKEIRKILNQINLYGYDLVTALNNASKSVPSQKLAELFVGLSTSVTSGVSLSTFFEKRAESLLIGYRLEREKYTKIAETFMDIYISVLIAAPMILLLLVIMLSVTGIGISLAPWQIGLLVMVAVGLLNVFFLIFLHMRQPVY